MDQSPSWECTKSAASQEIPRILWNPKVQYCILECPVPIPIPSQINPHHASPSHSWRNILILSTHLRLCLPSNSFPQVSYQTLYAPLLSPIHAACPAHLIFLYLITRIIFGEEYRSQNSSLCSLPHSLVTSSVLGPSIFRGTLFSNNLGPHIQNNFMLHFMFSICSWVCNSVTLGSSASKRTFHHTAAQVWKEYSQPHLGRAAVFHQIDLQREPHGALIVAVSVHYSIPTTKTHS